LNENWKIEWEQLEQKLKGGLDGLIISNPGNPSTYVLRDDEIKKLVELASKYNCWLFFDEVLADMVWSPNKMESFLNLYDLSSNPKVIVGRSFSKSLGCQSWRLGYCIAHEDTIERLKAPLNPINVCAPIQQYAIARYLDKHLQDYVDHLKKRSKIMQNNIKIFSEAFTKSLGWKIILPHASMYACFLHNSDTDMDAVKKAMEKGVAVSPGSHFFEGSPESSGIVRISLALPEEKAKKIAKRLSNP